MEFNYYWMNYNNQLVLTGQLDDVGNPIRANVGKSYRTGIEVSGAWRISQSFQWNANATWSVNRNVDYIVDAANLENAENTSIIMSPAWIAGSQLIWNLTPAFQASWLSKYVGEQYLDNTQRESLKLDAYFVNDLRLNYMFKKENQPSVTVSLLVNNIFNEWYESNGYSYDGAAYYYPQAGRNFLAMVSIRL
jgi:iron complex outermembrane receptor protein